MFKPSQDRLNYGSQLMPPSGYVLDKAVATTYSLDLEAVTAMCISLGLCEDASSELCKNPMSLLHALQKVSEKVIIFCESGQIKMPKNLHKLVLLIEKMIVPVALAKKDKGLHFPAFHPKTWLLVYSNEAEEKLYRFVVLSRNLTFDRSWDVMLTLDGKPQGPNMSETQPIRDFLEFLNGEITENVQLYSEKQIMLDDLRAELENVGFESEMGFDGFKLYPLGIGEKSYDIINGDIFSDKFSHCVIVSPFVSGSVIENFNNLKRCSVCGSRTLITRSTELQKLNTKNASNFGVYVVKDDIYNGEDIEIENKNEDVQKQDIHAKIYAFDNKDKKSGEIYLGSMNATEAARTKNVEMLARLTTNIKNFNCAMFRGDLFEEIVKDKILFNQVDIKKNSSDDFVDVIDDLELLIKNLCRENMEVCIEQVDSRSYRAVLSLELTKKYHNVMISPLIVERFTTLSETIVFDNLSLLELSEFYKVRVFEELENGETRNVERIIKIHTIGMPDGRDAAVVNSVIKDKRTFLAYIAFVLGDDYILSLLESIDNIPEGKMEINPSDNSQSQLIETYPPIYEKMLKTALRNPDRIRDIANVLRMIEDPDIVPVVFREMYALFESVLQEGVKDGL